MTEQEQKDLEELKRLAQRKKELLYDMLRTLDRADQHYLEISGYNKCSNAEAMRKCFQNIEREIQNLFKAHTKKYPD